MAQAEVEGYADNYPPDAMLFMDFRRHHTGLYDGTASRCGKRMLLLRGTCWVGRGVEWRAPNCTPTVHEQLCN